MLSAWRHLEALKRPPCLLALAALLASLLAATGYPQPAPPASGGCCAARCGCPADDQARGGCCCSPRARAPRQEAGPSSASPTWGWVIAAERGRCRGQATTWLGVAAALPPAAPVALPLEHPVRETV